MTEEQRNKIANPDLKQNTNGSWGCDICGFEAVLREDTITHRVQHFMNENSKQCPICYKVFSQQSSLKCHLTIHTGVKRFRCKYCGKKFGWKTQVARHETLHTGKGLHNCQVCAKSFVTKWLLTRHMKIHDKVSNKKPFIYNSMLYNPHHNNERKSVMIDTPPTKCQECGFRCENDEMLAYHLLEHNTVKNEDSSELSGSSSHFNTTCDNLSSENEIVEKFKLVKPASKNLTTIVSKLHNKVDEIQSQHENEETVTVRVVEDDNVGGKWAKGMDFQIDNKSNQQDPFICGISDLILEQTSTTPTSMNSDKAPVTNDTNANMQAQIVRLLFSNIRELYGKHANEITLLNNKIDSLTNLVTSQSLILNRILLGGKMSVSGTLDFNIEKQ